MTKNKECLGFEKEEIDAVLKGFQDNNKDSTIINRTKFFPCVPVLKLDELIKWGELEQANNNIYRKSTDELNEDWIEKVKELKGGLNGEN